MTTENIAKVLTNPLENRRFKEEQAQYMIKGWFWHNPVELHNLPFEYRKAF
jgi:hypothetical protein